MQIKKIWALLCAAALFSAFLYTPSEAQSQQRTIVSVGVKGNHAISESTILSKIKTKPGMPFSQEVINDDIKRLYALGYFTDVAIDAEDTKDGIVITIIVDEKPVISEIIFEGNKKIRTPHLKKIMQLKEGDMMNFSKLAEDITAIKSFYERSGFHRAKVKYELGKDPAINMVSVKITVQEEERVRIKKINVEGNKAVKTKTILEIMQTRPAWFFRRGYLDDELFENDLARIKLHYRDEGYLDATVAPKFDYDEAKGIMYITLLIDEGDLYTVGDVTVKGNIVFPEEEIAKKISIKKGDAFSYAKLRENIEEIRSFYYQNGYMNSEISVDRTLDPATKNMNLTVDIDAKDVVYVGKIEIKGNTKTKDVVIRRELRSYPGEKFDGEKIRRSKERLYNLGFFEDIFFETRPTQDPTVNDLEVSVKETKTGEFAFGGGYSSVDEFIGFVQVTQKNFDLLNFPYFTGDGQHLAIRAEVGTVRSDFDVSWTEPWIFDYPLSFGLDGYHRTHYRRTHVGYGYREVRSGGDVRFAKEFLEYFRGDLIYQLENVEITDVPDDASQDFKDEAGRNWISSMVGGVTFDNRDNIYSPTKGFVTGLSVGNTGGFLLGDKNYVKGFYYASFYYSPIEKITIELKGRAGLADGYGKTKKVPIYDRFYAGGAYTIRGYQERRVGPRDPVTNDPLGGESTLIGNIELTFPIYEKLIKGAVFYDVGNVWEKVSDFVSEGGYKQGVGVGVRVKTPIGPISVDWGYPLSDNYDDERKGEFYFSASHGF